MWDVRWSRGRILRHNAGFISCSDSKDHSNHFASDNIRSKAIYTLSGLLKHNATAIAQFEAVGGWDTLRDAFSLAGIVPSPSYLYHPSSHSCMMRSLRALRSDSDIGVRRKPAFLLNSLLTSSAPASAATTTSAGGRVHSGPPQAAAPVHPNSHASMLADPMSVDTASETHDYVRTGCCPC